jgi:hypothetical protein
MKTLLILLVAAFTLAACQGGDKKVTGGQNVADTALNLSQEEKDKAMQDVSNFTTLEWIDPVNTNLGKLVKGQSVEVSFRFKNTGDKQLVITDVSAGCGCTIPEKPEKPIAPGEEGVIRARYDGSGGGHITKSIFVKANTTPATDFTLTFEGDIKE